MAVINQVKPMQKLFSLLLILVMTTLSACSQSSDNPYLKVDSKSGKISLTASGASFLSDLALHCIHQEFPNKLSHVINDETEIKGHANSIRLFTAALTGTLRFMVTGCW
ncbi:MAG: hypothetical protein R3B93_21785 [Bacteroidia bacterium]